MSQHHDRFTAERGALSRRAALGMLGALGAAAAVRSNANGATPAASPPLPACVVTPAETEGPFFVDERLNRSDLTTGTTRPGVVNGVPLRLRFAVYRVNGGACMPLAGATVDVWHTDALGVYSDVRELNSAGQTFLRGFQVTDRDGLVAFDTIYPGWYAGRTVHVHFKVRTAAAPKGVARELTTQIYFDDAISDAVFATAPYVARGPRGVRNAHDGLFERALLVPLQKATRGYAGTFSVGLNTG